jgi:hypothetical protein
VEHALAAVVNDECCGGASQDKRSIATCPRNGSRCDVYGAPQPLGECQDGPGGSCKMDEFAQFVERRMELYGDRQRRVLRRRIAGQALDRDVSEEREQVRRLPQPVLGSASW